MKKKLLLLPLAAALIYVTLCSYSTGAAATGGIDGTGATTAAGCSCHTHATTTTVAIELDSAGIPVTQYVGGGSYTIKITGTNTGTLTTLTHFGFQIAAVNLTGAGTSAATDAGTLQSTGLPASCQFTSTATSGLPINVVEHNTQILATTGTGGPGTTYVESIGWTAPVAGTGSIKLYGAVNAVNDDGTDVGDAWNNNNVTITEYVVPTLAPITGTFTVCSGSTTPLSSTYTTGTWSCTPTFVATVSATGVVSGLLPGTAVVSYNEGTAGIATATVTVTGPPVVPPITSSVTAVCQDASTLMTDGTAGGTWTSSAPGVASVNSSGSVTGVTGGTATISYSITNACATTTKTKAITVNPLPVVGSITGSSGGCISSPFNLTDTSTGGSWSSSNSAVATVSGGTVTGITTGTVTINYSVTNSCGTSSASDVVIISTTPVVDTVSGGTTICQGATTTLTDATTGGTWSSSDNAIASVSTGGMVTGISGGAVTIPYTISNACGSASASATITVNPLPNVGVITGASTLCQGTVDTLTDLTGGGTWSSSDSTIASVTDSGIVTGLAGGIDTISYSATNSCGTSSAIEVIGVIGSSAGIITGHSSVCLDSVILLSDSLAGGTWSLSNGSAEIASGIVVGATPGIDTVYYTISSPSCGTVSSSFEITVVDCSATSVGNVSAAITGFKVYPNPSSGTFLLDIPKAGNTANIAVIDMMGRLMDTKTIATPQSLEASIDLSNLPSGNYFIRVNTGDKTYREKISIIK